MKKTVLMFLILLFTMTASAAYKVGDILPDFTWEDNITGNQSLTQLTGEGKTVVFFWGGTS